MTLHVLFLWLRCAVFVVPVFAHVLPVFAVELPVVVDVLIALAGVDCVGWCVACVG